MKFSREAILVALSASIMTFAAAGSARAACDPDCQMCLTDCKSELAQCRGDAEHWYGICVADCNANPYDFCLADCGKVKTADMKQCNDWSLQCQRMCYVPAGANTLIEVTPGQVATLKDASKKVKAKQKACRTATVESLSVCRSSCAAGDGSCLRACRDTQLSEIDTCYKNALFEREELLLKAKNNPK